MGKGLGRELRKSKKQSSKGKDRREKKVRGRVRGMIERDGLVKERKRGKGWKRKLRRMGNRETMDNS